MIKTRRAEQGNIIGRGAGGHQLSHQAGIDGAEGKATAARRDIISRKTGYFAKQGQLVRGDADNDRGKGLIMEDPSSAEDDAGSCRAPIPQQAPDYE